MSIPKQILIELDELKLVGLSEKVEKFFKPLSERNSNLGRNEVNIYYSFIKSCLHACFTKQTSAEGKEHVHVFLKLAVLCCKVYEKIFHSLDQENLLVVPTLVYRMTRNIQEQEHFEMAISLSELTYKMLVTENKKVPMEAHTIINYFFEYLWKTSCRHTKESQLGGTIYFERILKMQKLSLMFQSLLPDTDQLPVQARAMVAHVTQFHKDDAKNQNIGCDSWQIVYSTFEEVIRVIIKNSFHEVSDKDVTLEVSDKHIIVLQAQAMFIECLLKFCKFEKVNEMLKTLMPNKSPSGSSPVHIMADLYSLSVHVSQVRSGKCFATFDWTVLQKANINAKELINKCSLAELNLILGAYSCFIQTFGVNVSETLTADIVMMYLLLEVCDILETLSTKLITESACKFGDVERKKGGDVGEILKLLTNLMIAFYSQLQFILHILQQNLGEEQHLSEIRQKSILLASRFENVLKENAGTLSKNSIYAKKYNLGYICLKIGSIFYRGSFYEEAASMLSIAAKQLHSCQQPSMLQAFELQTESYQKLEKWTEAINVVVQALMVLPDKLATIVTLWASLKRDAIAKKPTFQSMTLKKVSQSLAVSLVNISPRQILMAEYAAWTNFSRRDYVVEYYILCELLDACDTDVKKQVEVLIDLAANLCITRMKHKDRSAVDLLNEAVAILEKAAGGSDALLALVYYNMFVVMHEDVIEQLQEDLKVESEEISDESTIGPKTNYTLQSDQSYFLYLLRAIDIWEESLGKRESEKKFDKSKQKSNSCTSDNDKENCKAEIDTEAVFLISLERHIDTQILCGERLLAMKQPQLALRPLQIAQDQLSTLNNPKRAGDLSIQLGRTLMILGQYQEAESYLAVGISDDQVDTRKSLLLSELYLCMGKREKGLEILRSIPVGSECKKMSQNMCMASGTVKRLLSMSLCFPGNHIIQSDNQYLLSLASEAVHCHITVFNSLTNKNLLNKNADKWQLLYEILQSLLHFCQLCRFTGLRSNAICYIREGVNISQVHGLPRWSCEFLLELFEMHCMVADCEKAVLTAESITNLLNASNKSTNCLKEDVPSRTKSATISKDKSSCVENSECSRVKNDFNSEVATDDECFGFENLAMTPVVKHIVNLEEPECIYKHEKLDIDTKNKLLQMSVPECLCRKSQVKDCKDIVTHRLCMKAGIAMSDFLLQCNLRPASERLLSEVQSKFNGISNWSRGQDVKLSEISNGVGNQDINGISYWAWSQNSQLMYINLEASCIQAESFLLQQQYSKVHQVWLMFQELDRAGYLQNVLHSHILMTRLALSEAGTYMLSLNSKRDSVAQKEPLETDDCVSTLSTDMSKLALSKKKVSFCHESEPLSDSNGSHTSKLELTLDCCTPKTSKLASTSSSLKKSSSHKLAGNLMNVLNQLMESDNTKQEDFVVFSDESKVTRKVNEKSLKIKSAKSKTEPSYSLKKKLEQNPEYSNIVCKLDFANGSSTEWKHLENNENSTDENTRKQTEMCMSSTGVLTLSTDMSKLAFSKKKVSFFHESEPLSDSDGSHTSKLELTLDCCTPQTTKLASSSSSLTKSSSHKLADNFMNALNQLMESDDTKQEDFEVFSDESKGTRKVNEKSSKIKSAKSKAEHRYTLKKKLEQNPKHSNAVCKLDFANGSSTDQKHLENNENSADENTIKQTEMCMSSADEVAALKCISKNVESKLKSANRAGRKSSKAAIVNNAVNAVQNIQVESLRVKFDGDVGNDFLNGVALAADLAQSEATKGDVFDFALEASPVVSKGTQSGKTRKKKGTQNQKMTGILKKTARKNSCQAASVAFENLEVSPSQENMKDLLNTSYCKKLVESKKIRENMNSAHKAPFEIEKMRSGRKSSKAVVVNGAVNTVQNMQVGESLRVKFDGDVGSKLLNGVEDFVVSSNQSQVTQQVNRNFSKIASVKSKAEPRYSLKKKLEQNPEHINIVCKLDFANGSSTDQKHLENNENSADENTRKQTEMCMSSADEVAALKRTSKNVESKLRSANRAGRKSSKAAIVNNTVNAVQNIQVESLRVKFDGDVVCELLNGVALAADLAQSEAMKGGVFDFALKASPVVSKGTQSGKTRKKKGTQNQKMTGILKKTARKNSCQAASVAFENLEVSPSQENMKDLLNTSYCKKLVESKKIRENMNSAHKAPFEIEKMRSDQLSNMNECFGKINHDEQEPLCRIVTAAEHETPCQGDIILSLESMYNRLSRYPPSPQHSDVCNMLALHYLDSKPSRAAFLLSDAIAVTFRHQAMLNVGSKVRKLLNDSAGRSEIVAQAMLHVVKPDVMFGVDDHQWHDLLTTIPEDWCAVQLSVVGTGLPQRQMILTRFVKGQDPLVLRLPAFNSIQGRRILSEFSSIIEQMEQASKILLKTEWWQSRGKLNLDLQNLIDRMEMYLLGIWRCAVLAPEHSTKVKLAVQKILKETLKQSISLAHIEVLLLGCKVLSSVEMQQCLSQVLVTQCSSADYERVIALLKKYTSDLSDNSNLRHTVLILDKTIQHLPWESMPVLQDKSVTRMPCLSHLCTQLNYLQRQENSVFINGVDPCSTYYILNPDSDLPRTEEHFRDWFTNRPDWKGVCGTRPSSDQFTEALTQRDLLIYCGHGSGSKYFNSDKIEKLNGRAAVMLMGCSSGRLLVKGQLEPSGMMISYFLAGCPCMIANLWDVTDKDIDKFTMKFLKSWLSAPNGSYLPSHVQKARAVCKLKYLNGSAPVVYGLPVFVKQK